MEHPEREIAHVVHLLTTSTDPEVQKQAVEKYYAPDVQFRHPVCEAHDRKSLLAIYQWYRIMSPSHTLDVESVTYNRDKHEVFLDITQTFHLRWSPLSPGPARLVTHLTLRPAEKDKSSDKTHYLIAAHEDFYQQADLAMLVAPPLVPVVRAALVASTLACRALAFGFSNVLGCWRVPTPPATPEGEREREREKEKEREREKGGEGEHEKEGGKGVGATGAGTGAKVPQAAGTNGNRRRKHKKNGFGGYADAAREAVGEMQDKGLNAI